jgi:hypothetical protein
MPLLFGENVDVTYSPNNPTVAHISTIVRGTTPSTTAAIQFSPMQAFAWNSFFWAELSLPFPL